MSKTAYFTILAVLLLAAVTVLNITGVNVSEETKFVRVSVLAQDQADYGVDEAANTIPAISPAIIEDKVHDITPPETVKTIKYTTLPAENSGPAGEEDDDTQTVDLPKTKNEHPNNGNNGTSQSQDNNPNQNNGNNKETEKENKQDKNTGPNKDTGATPKTDKTTGDTTKTQNK